MKKDNDAGSTSWVILGATHRLWRSPLLFFRQLGAAVVYSRLGGNIT